MLRMKSVGMCAMAVLALFITATMVQAEGNAPPPKPKALMGKVKSVDADGKGFVLTTGRGENTTDKTVKVNADTKYLLDGKASSMADVVKVGQKVKVTPAEGTAATVESKTPARTPAK